ncbi:MAG: hypothetical protein ABEI07_01300 [Candidatus Nanohaloarchaea archaeon]
MKPAVTFLTSSELQQALGNPLSDEEEEELRQFRNRVMESFGNLEEALEEMEELYGRGWKTFDASIWLFRGNQESISSPILIREEGIEEVVFETFRMLAKRMIRDDPPDSELIEEGYAKLDAVSALLASEALERVMDGSGYEELMDEVKPDADELKTWRKVEEIEEDWDPESEPLYEWLEGR